MVTNIRDLQVREDVIVTIQGTVVGVREDEFILQDATGQILVDAVRGGSGTIALSVGEQVTVMGDLDDLEDFDASQIIRADGSVVVSQTVPMPGGGGRPGGGDRFDDDDDFGGPPPWAGRPGGPRGRGAEGPPPWAGQPGGPRRFFAANDLVSGTGFAIETSIF
jgi:hypothetical protein